MQQSTLIWGRNPTASDRGPKKLWVLDCASLESNEKRGFKLYWEPLFSPQNTCRAGHPKTNHLPDNVGTEHTSFNPSGPWYLYYCTIFAKILHQRTLEYLVRFRFSMTNQRCWSAKLPLKNSTPVKMLLPNPSLCIDADVRLSIVLSCYSQCSTKPRKIPWKSL